MNFILKNLFVIFFILLLSLSIEAQQFFVKNYTLEDGLPTRMVNDACQDTEGNMWFATYYGISKYDGFNFINYNKNDGLVDVFCRKLRCDEKGILWTVPYNTGGSLVFFKNDKWTKYIDFPKRNRYFDITSFDIIYKNNQPVICVGSYGGVDIFEKNTWKHYDISSNPDSNITNSLIANNGKFYISTKKGLCIYENSSLDWSINKKINPDYLEILAVNFEDFTKKDYRFKSPDIMWVLSNNWLGYLKNNEFRLAATNIVLPVLSLSNFPYMDFDRNGNLFFGNNLSKYLYIKKINTASLVTTKNGFSSKGGSSLFIDKEYNVWFTDSRGIDKISNTSLLNYFESDGLPENEVTAILEINKNKFILGHNNHLSIFENFKFKSIQFPSIQNNLTRVMDIIKDNDGNIIFTANNLGVGKLLKNGVIKWIKVDNFTNATALFQDKKGKIWVGTNKKLFYLKDDKLIEYEHNNIINNNIRKIYAAQNGGIYITGMNGLWLINEDKVTKIPSIDKKAVLNVFSYYRNNLNVEFVGTMDGLYVIENGKIVKYKKNNIEINTPLYFIFQDKNANYWLGSNNGVYYWDGKSKLEIYNPNNGLAGIETNRSAGITDSLGRIWIGTEKGLSCFSASFSNNKILPPKVKLLYYEDSKGLKYPLNKKTKINNNDNTLTFHFRGLSFYNENLIQYTYKLEGLDNVWHDATQSMLDKIKYYNIKPGKYTLLVKAKNYAGEWSETTKSETITILKPFYISWWFLSVSFIIIILIIMIIIRIRLHNAYNKLLLKEISERKHAEEEIKRKSDQLELTNREKDKFFSIIAHDLRSPFNAFLGLTEIMAEELNSLSQDEIKSIAESMKKSARKLFSLLENLLQWSRMQQGIYEFQPIKINLKSIINHNIDLYKETCINKDITVINNINDKIEIEADAPMINSIVRNLISNAVKFTPRSGYITIFSKNIDDNKVEIYVQDTGIGMSEDFKKKLFRIDEQTSRTGTEGEASTGLGLLLCKEFVEKHAGIIKIESEEGKGSIFSFTMKLLNQ